MIKIIAPTPQMVPGDSGASGASNDVSSEGMDISGVDIVGASGATLLEPLKQHCWSLWSDIVGASLPLDEKKKNPKTVILSKKRLQALGKEIGPLEGLDSEDVLLQCLFVEARTSPVVWWTGEG